MSTSASIKEGLNSIFRYIRMSGDGREQLTELQVLFESCVTSALVSKRELLKVLSASKYGERPEFKNHFFVTGVVAKDKSTTLEESVGVAGATNTTLVESLTPTEPVEVPDVLLTFEQVFNELRDILGWDTEKQTRVKASAKIEKMCYGCPSTSVATVDVISAVLDDGIFGAALKIDFVPDRYKTLSESDKAAGVKLPFTSHPIFFTADPARLTWKQLETLYKEYFDFGKVVLDADRAFYKAQERAYNKLSGHKASSKHNEQRSILITRVPMKKFMALLHGIIGKKDTFWNSQIATKWIEQEAMTEPLCDISWDEVYRGLLMAMCPGVCGSSPKKVEENKVEIVAGNSVAINTTTTVPTVVPIAPTMPTSNDVILMQAKLDEMSLKYEKAMTDVSRLTSTISQQSAQISKLTTNVVQKTPSRTSVESTATAVKQSVVESAVEFVEQVIESTANAILSRKVDTNNGMALRSSRTVARAPAPAVGIVFGKKQYHKDSKMNF